MPRSRPLPRARVLGALACVLCAVLGAVPARSAPPPRLLAGAPDWYVREVLTPLLPVAADQLERYDTDACLVYKHRILHTGAKACDDYIDQVWWVRRGEAEDLTNYVKDFRPGLYVKEVKAFRIRAGAVDPAAAIAAPVEYLDEGRIHVTQGSREKSANVVVAFDSAEPGDLLAVSILVAQAGPLGWDAWLMADDLPVARAELRLKCTPGLAYTVFGSRFKPDQFRQEKLQEADGQLLDVHVWADDLQPLSAADFAPPWYLQSPQITVAWRASGIDKTDRGWLWWKRDSWNEIGGQMDAYEAAVLAKTKDADKLAHKLGDGLAPADAGAALYRYVREDLMDVPTGIYKSDQDLDTVDAILKAKSGDAHQKSFVMLAMLRALGQQADLVWVHDPQDGAFFMDYPSWGQVDTPLVRVRDADGERWYDLGCTSCAPGTVRYRCQGAQAALAVPGAAGTLKKLQKSVWNNATSLAGGLEDYKTAVANDNLITMFEVPNLAGRWVSWSDEVLTLAAPDAKDGKAALVLRSTGPSRLQDSIDRGRDDEDAVAAWTRKRFADAQEVTVRSLTAGGIDTLVADVTLVPAALPAAMGDTWILEPATVFGKPFISAWAPHRDIEFHIAHADLRRREVRIPLPEGWDDVELPQGLVVDAGPIMYRASLRVDDGMLVVVRVLTESAVRVAAGGRLETIRELLTPITTFESNPLVVRRKASTP